MKSPQIFFPSPFRAQTSLSSKNLFSLNPSLRSFTSQSNLPSPQFTTFCISFRSKSSDSSQRSSDRSLDWKETMRVRWSIGVGKPSVCVPNVARMSLSDQAFFLLTFIACTTSVAFTSLVAAAVPTLYAMGRTAISLSKLADTAREELPSTMAAIRLSGMEISDLTLELSDLSHEIADGVNKSTQAVKAAGAGIRQIGSVAQQQTISMIQERANLPVISLQPVVTVAAKKTSRAVGQATRSFIKMISQGEFSTENEEDSGMDRVEV